MRQLEQEYSGHAEGESDLKQMCQPGESCRNLSCPRTNRSEIHHKCREIIFLVQVCFRFELSLTVSKLLSKI